MSFYIAFVFPSASGGWEGQVPDLPGCRVEARSLDAALGALVLHAQQYAAQLMQSGAALPPARTLERLRSDRTWCDGIKLDFAQAVTSVVRVGG